MRLLRRLSAVLLAVVCLVGLAGLLTPAAQAGPRPRVSLAVSAKTAGAGTSVELSGEVSTSVRGASVVAQVRGARGWQDVASVRLGRERSFSFAVEPVLGDNAFRALLEVRGAVLDASPVRTVRGLLASDPAVVPAGSPVTVFGRLPTAVERAVELLRSVDGTSLPSLEATSDAQGGVSFTFVPVAGEVVEVHAPAVRRGRLPTFTSPALSLEVVGAPPVPAPDSTMPVAVVGEPYDSPVPGGTVGYGAQRVVSGEVPDGLRFTNFVGSLTGIPTTPGSYRFTVAFAGSTGETQATVGIEVVAEPPGPADGLTRVAVGLGQPPVLSGDGDVAVYAALVDRGAADRVARSSVFAWDRTSQTTREVSVGFGGATPDGSSGSAVVSADGRTVAFSSRAGNLVAGQDDADGDCDVFVAELESGSIERVTDGGVTCESQLALSADGRFLAYQTAAAGTDPSRSGPNVVLLDREDGSTRLVSHAADDPDRGVTGYVVGVATDGSSVTFGSASGEVTTDDRHPSSDVFQWDAATGTNELVTGAVASDALFGRRPVASADGRFVAYQVVAGMLVGTSYVWDRESGEAVAVPDPGQLSPGDRQLTAVSALSADGRYALLEWSTTAGRSEVYRWDRSTDELRRVDARTLAGRPVVDARAGSLSDDGRFATFQAIATGLATYGALWDAEG